MRIALLGNSGSGKSTLARWLAGRAGAPLLDLDTVAWEAGQVAVAREPWAALHEVMLFCTTHEHWVVEGCYANLVAAALPFQPRLLFLDPGEATCLAHCRARPWEPHKYGTKAEQDERLAFLLTWVREYYTREGDLSWRGHRACFDGYAGPKEELAQVPDLAAPPPGVLAWLA